MTPDEFRETTREHFGYLVKDYGFIELPFKDYDANGCVIEYVSDKTRVILEISGWFLGIGVYLTDIDSKKVKYGSYPLSDLLKLRNVEPQLPEYKNDTFSDEDLLVEIRVYARALREHASDILSGDHSIFPVLERRTAERLSASRNQMMTEGPSE